MTRTSDTYQKRKSGLSKDGATQNQSLQERTWKTSAKWQRWSNTPEKTRPQMRFTNSTQMTKRSIKQYVMSSKTIRSCHQRNSNYTVGVTLIDKKQTHNVIYFVLVDGIYPNLFRITPQLRPLAQSCTKILSKDWVLRSARKFFFSYEVQGNSKSTFIEQSLNQNFKNSNYNNPSTHLETDFTIQRITLLQLFFQSVSKFKISFR